MRNWYGAEGHKLREYLDSLSIGGYVLQQIKNRNKWWSMDGYNQTFNNEEQEYTPTPLSADEWQAFKRDFVETYGGETVKPNGMTNSDLLDYIATSVREGDEWNDNDDDFW